MFAFEPGKPSLFPKDEYTPHGYLYTPRHTGTAPGGLLRSVPPLGFGLYRRGFTWYGLDALNSVNAYLSLLLPSVRVNGALLAETEDFEARGVKLISAYHSSHIMSYDFELDGVAVTLAWYSDQESTLYCRAALRNVGDRPADVRLDAAHAYGMNGKRWWGSDAVTARYLPEKRAIVSKILAYGDVYALSSEEPPASACFASTWEKLDAHRREGRPLPATPPATPMPGPLYALLEWDLTLQPGEEKRLTLALTRAVNEKAALRGVACALDTAAALLRRRMDEDNAFCQTMPTLGEGWPDWWRRGMVYNFQTLRMNVYPPMGIFTHRWDGMQTANPRMVLGETCIDMLALRYADPDTALEVLTTTFEDSPDVYVPCCREDGSVNMIGSDGSECATALMWGFPWKVLRALLAETRNVAWLRRLYPRLKACIEWWRENRTDAEGWYHCNNSWESGQDGSKRFVTGEDEGCPEGMNADHVRAVDLESTMAQTAQIMAEFAAVLGETADEAAYRAMYERGAERVRRMFFADRYRDVNALTGQPFMADAHDDPMLTMPLATGQATPEQMEKTRWILDELIDIVNAHDYQPNGAGVFWPSILQTLCSALLETGRPEDAAHVAATLSDTAWKRDDSRRTWPRKPIEGIPDRYHRLIPGNARETLSDDIVASGTENYGWGCVDIALFGDYILGLRARDALGEEFDFQPVLPRWLQGERFVVSRFPLLGLRADIVLERAGDGLRVTLRCEEHALRAQDEAGQTLACWHEMTLTLRPEQKVILTRG
mgnify:CR=1 FL=1